MFYVRRKMTEKLVGKRVSEEGLELFLSILPTGVYSVEDSDGNEVNVATVRRGVVEYRDCYGPRPEDEVLSNGAVVTFAPALAG